jgi:succinate dehydrogenase / fumarate reductase membrane anchor subunit
MIRFRNDLARVRGLGSAKEGVQHWWLQRVTAILLVPLTIWFLIELVAHVGAGHRAVMHWLDNPIPLAGFLLLLGAGFWHLALGLQVVIEDYVHREGLKLALILLTKFACLALALAGMLSLFTIAFGR